MTAPLYAVAEPQRQIILLALAKLELERPGWNYVIGEIAEVFYGREMYERFKQIHAADTKP